MMLRLKIGIFTKDKGNGWEYISNLCVSRISESKSLLFHLPKDAKCICVSPPEGERYAENELRSAVTG